MTTKDKSVADKIYQECEKKAHSMVMGDAWLELPLIKKICEAVKAEEKDKRKLVVCEECRLVQKFKDVCLKCKCPNFVNLAEEKLLEPLTIEEAEKAYDKTPEMPLSKEYIDDIVKKVTSQAQSVEADSLGLYFERNKVAQPQQPTAKEESEIFLTEFIEFIGAHYLQDENITYGRIEELAETFIKEQE